MNGDANGWSGRDPRLRLLRSIAIVVLACLLVWLVVIEDGPNDLPTIGTVLGAMLVALGFEAGIRWRQ